MNKLYALLVASSGDVPVTGYYAKRFYPMSTTSSIRNIGKMVLAGVPDDRMTQFICFVCNMAVQTVFGAEIQKLDPENTYTGFTRPPETAGDDEGAVVYDLTRPASEYSTLIKYLDDDIRDRLVVPEWTDIIAGACLQMLRWSA